MKRFPRFLAVLLLAVAVSATLVYATPPWKPAAWKVAKEQYNIIKAVNTTTGTVSIHHVGGKDKQDRDLTTNTFTDIVVDGKKAPLSALKVGMHVDYTLGGSGDMASRIEESKEQPPPPTPVATATPSFPKSQKKK